MAVKAIAHSYWRRIKADARSFSNVPDTVKDDDRTLAKDDVENNKITKKEYETFLNEVFR